MAVRCADKGVGLAAVLACTRCAPWLLPTLAPLTLGGRGATRGGHMGVGAPPPLLTPAGEVCAVGAVAPPPPPRCMIGPGLAIEAVSEKSEASLSARECLRSGCC
jgi:hypothetical protein